MSQAHLNVAIAAAEKAGAMMRRQLDQSGSVPVAQKARHDYVSEVDRACEAEIVREISRYYPDHAILAEEGGASGESDHVWIVDPLDGTSNYLHGIPHFAVSIALQVGGRTEVGVVFDPMRDEMFTAIRGKGAFLNRTRIRVSQRNGLEGAIIATAFPFRQRQHMGAYLNMFKRLWDQVEDFRRAGTASLDLAYTACGRVDGFFEIGLKPWDVAAGALLVREAGGVVSDFSGSDAVEHAGTVIAAPYKVMTPLRRVIEPRWKAAMDQSEG
ncbi:MAG: inositol monophosphatase family protein [Xanthomonadales bacterium]|nr:inositol monophosphatase family protein [Xanthomonadales bacterium]